VRTPFLQDKAPVRIAFLANILIYRAKKIAYPARLVSIMQKMPLLFVLIALLRHSAHNKVFPPVSSAPTRPTTRYLANLSAPSAPLVSSILSLIRPRAFFAMRVPISPLRALPNATVALLVSSKVAQDKLSALRATQGALVIKLSWFGVLIALLALHNDLQAPPLALTAPLGSTMLCKANLIVFIVLLAASKTLQAIPPALIALPVPINLLSARQHACLVKSALFLSLLV
jgi:hypothetical protein